MDDFLQLVMNDADHAVRRTTDTMVEWADDPDYADPNIERLAFSVLAADPDLFDATTLGCECDALCGGAFVNNERLSTDGVDPNLCALAHAARAAALAHCEQHGWTDDDRLLLEIGFVWFCARPGTAERLTLVQAVMDGPDALVDGLLH